MQAEGHEHAGVGGFGRGDGGVAGVGGEGGEVYHAVLEAGDGEEDFVGDWWRAVCGGGRDVGHSEGAEGQGVDV